MGNWVYMTTSKLPTVIESNYKTIRGERPCLPPKLLNITCKGFVFPFIFTIFVGVSSDMKNCVFDSIPPHCEMRRVFLSLHKI